MGFKRFLAWLAEKLIELHLGVAALLAVKFLLPVTPEAYVNLNTFLAGMRDTWSAAAEEATYTTSHYLDGSWSLYAFNTYVGAAYLIGWLFYVSSLYVLLSLLAAALAHRHYRVWALGVYVLAFGVFCWRFIQVYDARNMYTGACLFGLGAIIVIFSAGFGIQRETVRRTQPGSSGRVRLDFSQ